MREPTRSRSRSTQGGSATGVAALRRGARARTVLVSGAIGATLLALVAALAAPAQTIQQVTVEDQRTVMKSGREGQPFDVTRHTIPLDEIVAGGPAIDGIPALGLAGPPRFVPKSEAGWLDDDDRIIGVRIGDQAKAYPLQILNYHEAANDNFVSADGEPIPVAVVWCPLCGSATVMSRSVTVDGEERVLKFGVSGKLFNANVLLYDRQTYSLWSQFTGGAVTGPLAGVPYDLLPSETIPVPLSEQDVQHTTWKDWSEEYPDSRVLAREDQVYPGQGGRADRSRDYDKDPYASMPRRVGRRVVGTYDYHQEGTPLMVEPQNRPEDDRLDDKARVVGVSFGNTFKAYPLEALEVAGGEVTDTVDGRTVTLRRENEYSVEATDGEGDPIPVHHTYWFAWYAFHPDTQLFWPEGMEDR